MDRPDTPYVSGLVSNDDTKQLAVLSVTINQVNVGLYSILHLQRGPV